MSKQLVVLTLPLILGLFVAAQQVSTAQSGVAHGQRTLPAPTSTTAYDPYFPVGRGYWERNYLIYVPPRDYVRVDLYDKDTFRSSVKVSIPNSNDAGVSDATVTEDGRLIVSGSYWAEKGLIHGFVGVANPDGRVSPMVDTGMFSPRQVTTCDGASVWAMGWLRSGPYFDRDAWDEPYPILREYRLADGKMVASALERTTFAHWPPPAHSGHDSPDLTMRCSGKLVGIYEGASDEWIEYDLSTNKLRRWKLPKQDHPWAEQDKDGKILPKSNVRTRVSGIAMLDSGGVYASFRQYTVDTNQAKVGLYRLEKGGDQGDWIAIEGTVGPANQPGAFDQLNGTDGEHLVYSRSGERNWFFSAAPE
jgi:hypothetical protein